MIPIRYSKVIAASFITASLALSVSAEARPADPAWRPAAKLQPAEQTCGPILERVTYGRSGYTVVGSRGDCSKSREVERWVGPRGTVPFYR